MKAIREELITLALGLGMAVWAAACTSGESPGELGDENAVFPTPFDGGPVVRDASTELDAGGGLCDPPDPDPFWCEPISMEAEPEQPPEISGGGSPSEIYLGVDPYDSVEGVMPEGADYGDPPNTNVFFANQNPGLRLGCLSKNGLDRGQRWNGSQQRWFARVIRVFARVGEIGSFTWGQWLLKIDCVFVQDPADPRKATCQADPKVTNPVAGGTDFWPIYAANYDKKDAIDAPTNGLASWGKANFGEAAGVSLWAMPVISFNIGAAGAITFVINNASVKDGRTGTYTDICVLKDLNAP